MSPFREVSLLIVATAALVTAMTLNGVRRLVCITAVGPGTAIRGHGPCSALISIAYKSRLIAERFKPFKPQEEDRF